MNVSYAQGMLKAGMWAERGVCLVDFEGDEVGAVDVVAG
jgi:hypothetical protein